MITEYLRKGRRNLIDYGVGITLSKIISGLISPFYLQKELTFYEIDLNSEIIFEKKDTRLSFAFLEGNDKDYIRQIGQMAEWLAGSLKARIENGAVCLAAIKGGEVLGFSLSGRGTVEIPNLKLRIQMNANEVWGEQISVKRQYRKLGISKGLRKYLYRDLQGRAVKNFYGHYAENNISSKMAVRNYTSDFLVAVRYRKVLSREDLFLGNPRSSGNAPRDASTKNTFAFSMVDSKPCNDEQFRLSTNELRKFWAGNKQH
jgi:hypothetical protein